MQESIVETLALVESNPRCLPHFLMTHQKYDDDRNDDHDVDDEDEDDDVDYSSFCLAGLVMGIDSILLSSVNSKQFNWFGSDYFGDCVNFSGVTVVIIFYTGIALQ